MDNENEIKHPTDENIDRIILYEIIGHVLVFAFVFYVTRSVTISAVVTGMFISGSIGAQIGARRGAWGIGFLMSFFVPVIGWIIACFLPKDESKTTA